MSASVSASNPVDEGVAGAIESREIGIPAEFVDGYRWPMHTHPDEHELLWAITGRVTVVTPRAHFVAPRGASVWIPAGVPHDVHASGDSSIRCSWFDDRIAAPTLTTTTVLVTPTLFDRVLEYAMLTELEPDERDRAEAFALDLLRPARTQPVELPRPRSPWLVAVTDALLRNPADTRSVEQWAEGSAVSTRTFARRFTAETGMGFARWRSELRHLVAVQRLTTGEPVSAVARSVGFESQASFTTAFHRMAGVTPGAYARRAAAR